MTARDAGRRAERSVIGLDGCREGWVLVALHSGRVEQVAVVHDLAGELTRRRPDATGVDTPIGLTDAPIRDADRAARALLRRRASSVFAAPLRSLVDAYVAGEVTTHAAASALSVALTGQGMSIQAWGIVPKVAEVDALVADGHELAEVHPEVAFTTLAGAPLARKTSWAGLEHRRALLRGCGIDLPADFDGASRCAPDDVVDAAVCAYVADGLAAGEGTITLPAVATERVGARPTVIVARRPPARG